VKDKTQDKPWENPGKTPPSNLDKTHWQKYDPISAFLFCSGSMR
jgi:hypothetical protein